ncbi:MAG TPA: hypothetical protein VM050_01290, partial [Patescibacteria group bacterium]|nr:hypothetical protein [Patescibacteria group bacterium]
MKLTAFSVILLLGFQVLVPGLAAVPRGGDRPGPEIPEDAQRFNFSDVDPYLFRHQFRTGTPNLYQFRNMTMQFNCSRDTELNITADPRLRMRLFDLRLDVDAPLRLRINATVTPPREMPGPRDGLHRYLDIEPNATSGVRATLRLYIDHEELHEELGRYVEAQRLRWCFWNGSDWEPVTSWMDGEGFLVCNTSHFSTWTIREMRNPPTMTPPEISGLSARVRAYNYTMVTPERFTWTIRERNGTAFVFKRTTMMFNCSQNLELNITAT